MEYRQQALHAALRAAHADGLAPEEEQMFRDLAEALEVPRDRADAMLSDVRENPGTRDP